MILYTDFDRQNFGINVVHRYLIVIIANEREV